MTAHNNFGQPVGEPLGDWKPPPFPPAHDLLGRTVELIPMDPGRDAPELFEAFSDAPDSLWTYMSVGPFPSQHKLQKTLETMVDYGGWLPYTIVVDGRPGGFASYLRIKPAEGVIEIGSITFAPTLQRTTAATEAIYLMISNAFELGYRRCEWKCDDLNEPSRSAAVRLGFTYEGTFRQATHYKGRNRDTAWYAIVDRDWPVLRAAFEKWLAPENFDYAGQQKTRLSELRGS